MDFDLTDEQRAIRETASELLGVRARDPAVWTALAELGWPGIAVAEKFGGQGLGLVELALLTEQLGYACASTPFLGSVLASLMIEEAGSEAQRERWLPDLALGLNLGALALTDMPSLIPDSAPDRLLITACRGDATAEIHLNGTVETVDAIDPGRAHGRLVGVGGGEGLDGDVAAALKRAPIIVAAELVGLSRRALDTTVAYIRERRQFGVPIGAFQAVQHTAAQMLRDTEAAAVATYYAAWAADTGAHDLPVAASIAKALASDAGRTVTASAIQLHGGIGFTWEADLHWLFKRAQVDALYLGGPGDHRVYVGKQLLATGMQSDRQVTKNDDWH